RGRAARARQAGRDVRRRGRDRRALRRDRTTRRYDRRDVERRVRANPRQAARSAGDSRRRGPRVARARTPIMPPPSRTLAHSVVAARDARPERYVVMLHGILGRGSNLQSIAQQWTAARPDWAAVLVDLREHGDSHGFAPPHTLAASTA